MSGNPGRASVELRETQAAFNTVRQGLIDAAIATPVEASLAREKLILAVQALDMVRETIQGVVDTGDLEAAAAEIKAKFAA
jgi:hypothetical protein